MVWKSFFQLTKTLKFSSEMAFLTDKTIHQPVTNCQYVQHIHLSIIYHDIVWVELHTTITVGKVHII